MGIPFYFREIVSQNKNIITNLSQCNRLYLDFNSIIHTCSQKVVTSKIWKHYDHMEAAIFEYITSYTHEVAKACTPSQLLYIAIDGVAPLAKMIQQRKRRHLSALQNTLINDFKKINNIPFTDWDSNCITPGTAFMKRLNAHLKSHFSNVRSEYTFEVVVSGADEQGEGEHKIIKYIKDLGEDRCTDVIYGLDADLIMLSLTCNKSNMYLMRESSHIQHGRGKHTQQQPEFKFVNIDMLRKSVGDFLYQKQPADYVHFMHDYVFICFLLGNDFLPHFLGFDLKYNGLAMICDAYRKVHQASNEYIISKDTCGYKVNYPILRRFLQALAGNEDEAIKANINTYFTTPYLEKPSRTPLEKFTNDLNFMPLTKRKKIIDPENDPFWKATYYKTFLHAAYSKVGVIDNICANYVHGLIWNVEYYFNGHATHSWFYHHTTAPLLNDVVRFMHKHDTLDPLCSYSSTDLDIADTTQLLLVLPFSSFKLLPSCWKDKLVDITSGMSHLYPISFQVKTFLKSQLWECTPVLPDVDLQRTLAFVRANPQHHPTRVPHTN